MNRILPILLGTTVCLSLAADSTGRITGKVMDKAGKPLPQAIVVLKRTSGINWTKTVNVSSNGSYMQVGLEPKEFDATASAAGYAPQTILIKIPLGDTFVQDFHLLTIEEAKAASRTSAQATAEADPAEAKAHEGTESFNQAVAFYNSKNYVDALPLTEKAYKAFRTSFELQPEDKKAGLAPQLAQVERVHGIVLYEVGKQDEARQKELWNQADPLLKTSLARNAKDQRVLDCLIEVSKAKGDAESTKKYEDALNAMVGPRPEVPYNEGVTAYNQGNLTGAKPFFQKAIKADPNFAEAYYMLAMCEFAENNLRATKRNFMKYIEIAPKGKHAEEVKAMLGDPSLKSIK